MPSCEALTHRVVQQYLYKLFSCGSLTQQSLKALSWYSHTKLSYSALMLCSHQVLPCGLSALPSFAPTPPSQEMLFCDVPTGVCSDTVLSVCSALMFFHNVMISLLLLELRTPNGIICSWPPAETKQAHKSLLNFILKEPMQVPKKIRKFFFFFPQRSC